MNKLYVLKEQTEKRTILYIGLGILLFFTAQIRTEGYFLFISLIVLQWKNRLLGWRFFLPYASALCIWFVFTLVFPSGYTEHFEHFKVVTLTNLLHNIHIEFVHCPKGEHEEAEKGKFAADGVNIPPIEYVA